jgi:hypothetical protein
MECAGVLDVALGRGLVTGAAHRHGPAVASYTYGGTRSMTRPREIDVATLLMCFFNVAEVVTYEPIEGLSAAASLALFAVVYTVIAAISFVVIWFFWRGRNWARWLVMATSVLALVNLWAFGSARPAEKAVLVAEALLGAWLLYWLNTPAARTFFRRGADPNVAPT